MSLQVPACPPSPTASDRIHSVEDLRVSEVKRLVTPAQVKAHLPAGGALLDGIRQARATARRIEAAL